MIREHFQTFDIFMLCNDFSDAVPFFWGIGVAFDHYMTDNCRNPRFVSSVEKLQNRLQGLPGKGFMGICLTVF